MALSIDYSWNVFRFLGDFLHAGSVFAVLLTLINNKNARGLSFKTQFFYLLIFITRYLDMFSLSHSAHSSYLFFFKLFYIISSASIVLVMRKWEATIETNKDTCSYFFVLTPCFFAALVSLLGSNTQRTFQLFFWTFSEFLEALAMLPQYIFTYRQDAEHKRSDSGIFLFISLVGMYRVLYACNWIYKKVMLGTAYTDPVSWIGGFIEIALFFDFILNREFLRHIVLALDSRVGQFSNQIELNVFARDTASELPGIRNRKLAATLDSDEAMLMI